MNKLGKRTYKDGKVARDKVSALFDCIIPIGKIILPILHIKLGVMAQFVKSLFAFNSEQSFQKGKIEMNLKLAFSICIAKQLFANNKEIQSKFN